MTKREVLSLALLVLAALAFNMLFVDFAMFGLFLTKIAHAIVALVMVRVVLYWFDKKMGINFKHRISNFDPQAMAIYFGCRFIGACVLFGLVFS